jgi:hypothetical protein
VSSIFVVCLTILVQLHRHSDGEVAGCRLVGQTSCFDMYVRVIILITKTLVSVVVLAPNLKKFVPMVIFLIMKVDVTIRPHSIIKHNGSRFQHHLYAFMARFLGPGEVQLAIRHQCISISIG